MSKPEEFEFALRFLNEHPKSAVKVLERSDVQAVAEILINAPVNYITPVLKYMLPEFTVRICKAMEAEQAASILSTLDANEASSILRMMPETDRAGILSSLPLGLRTNTKLLLDYPANTVGAWMSPHMLVVSNDLKNKNALKMLKGNTSKVNSDLIYVIDREGSYQGTCCLVDILKAFEDLPVNSTMNASIPSLSAQMHLEQARNHRAWNTADVLPVTNSENRLLGIFQHHSLRRGLGKLHQIPQRKTGADPLSGIFDVYGKSLLAVLNTVGEAMDNDY